MDGRLISVPDGARRSARNRAAPMAPGRYGAPARKP